MFDRKKNKFGISKLNIMQTTNNNIPFETYGIILEIKILGKIAMASL